MRSLPALHAGWLLFARYLSWHRLLGSSGCSQRAQQKKRSDALHAKQNLMIFIDRRREHAGAEGWLTLPFFFLYRWDTYQSVSHTFLDLALSILLTCWDTDRK